MSKVVSILGSFVLTALFCLIISNVDVKADGSADYDMPTSTSSIEIPSGSTWNQVMSSHGTPQPGSANTGWYTAFGFIGPGSDIHNTTYQYLPPISEDIQVTSTVYNGVTYNLKYPVAFINSYPESLAIPNDYTVYSGTRSVIYPSNGKPILSAFIMGSGQLLVEGAYSANYQYGVQDPNITYPFSFYSVWFESYTPNATYPFIWTKPHRNLQQGISDRQTIWCSYTDVPVFCDLYRALEYSTTGVIDSSNEAYVLFGADKAAADMVTPTPTDAPTPTPTATPIPQITGTVSIDGGTVNIGNFPTATPTPEPWFPYYDSLDPSPSVTPKPGSDEEYIDTINKGAIGVIGIPSVTPAETDFWEVDNTYLWKKTDGFFPDNAVLDFMYPDKEETEDYGGSVFRYPRKAMENVEDSGYLTFLTKSIHCFDRGSAEDEGIVGPGDNVITYILFMVVGIFVLWFFNHIIR